MAWQCLSCLLRRLLSPKSSSEGNKGILVKIYEVKHVITFRISADESIPEEEIDRWVGRLPSSEKIYSLMKRMSASIPSECISVEVR